jgi:hypothetical protein
MRLSAQTPDEKAPQTSNKERVSKDFMALVSFQKRVGFRFNEWRVLEAVREK